MFKLYQNNNAKCVVVSEVDDGFFVIIGKKASLDVEFLARHDFVEKWKVFEYDPRAALNIFLSFAKKHGASDRALAYLEEARVEMESASPDEIEQIFKQDDGSVPAISDGVAVDDAASIEAVAEALSEGVLDSPSGESALLAETIEETTFEVDKEISVSENNQENNCGSARLPIQNEKKLTAPEVLNGSPISVTVSKGGISVAFGDPEAGKMSPSAFDAKSCSVVVDGQGLSFYVAIDEKGIMARCITECHLDRKNVASIVGNWLAEGYLVERCDLKKMAKLVRLATKQPVADVQDVHPDA